MTPLHLFHFVPGVPPRPWSPLYFFFGDGGTSHRKAALTGFPRNSGSGRPNSFAPGSGAAAQHQSGRRGVDRGGFRVTLRAQLEMDERIHIVGGCYPSSHFATACHGTYGRYLEDQFPQEGTTSLSSTILVRGRVFIHGRILSMVAQNKDRGLAQMGPFVYSPYILRADQAEPG